MKIERKTQESNEISTSSLPYIIFMLLIFFMVTTVMREFDGLDVLMPRAKMIEKLESKRHLSCYCSWWYFCSIVNYSFWISCSSNATSASKYSIIYY